MAQGRLGLAKGRCREVQQQIDPVRKHGGDGIGTGQAVALQFLLDPEVFADGESQAPAPAVALQLQHGGLMGRPEVALLVEDVVGGQQPFAGHDPPLARRDPGGGVGEVGLLGLGDRLGHAHQQAQLGMGCRQIACQLVEDLLLLGEQGRPQQQIPGRVAPQRELWGEHQIGARGGGDLAGRQHLGAVAGQVAHQGIELGQGDTHQRGGEGARP